MGPPPAPTKRRRPSSVSPNSTPPSSPLPTRFMGSPLGTPISTPPPSSPRSNTPLSEHRIPATPNTPVIKKLEEIYKNVTGKEIKSAPGGVTSRIFHSPKGTKVTKVARATRISGPEEQLKRELNLARRAGQGGIGATVHENSMIHYDPETNQYYLFLVMNTLESPDGITPNDMNNLVKRATRLGINVKRNIHIGQFMRDPKTKKYKIINFGLARELFKN